MGDKTRSDGRKFTKSHWSDTSCYFEPIFLAKGVWHGKDEDDVVLGYEESFDDEWQEWHAAKKMKKIKLYRHTYLSSNGSCMQSIWREDQCFLATEIRVVKTEEKEIEVEE